MPINYSNIIKCILRRNYNLKQFNKGISTTKYSSYTFPNQLENSKETKIKPEEKESNEIITSTLDDNKNHKEDWIINNNNLRNFDIDWTEEFPKILKMEQQQPSPLAVINSNAELDNDELTDVFPELRPSFNFAAYANRSETLREFIKLGVDLSKWEKRQGLPEFILKLDFNNDVKNYLVFLNNTVGIQPDKIGKFFTKNPSIFKENIVDLHTRINYLQMKTFSSGQITKIIGKNPFWLMFKTQRIDRRLGYFQHTYKLSGWEIRDLVERQPKLITYNLESIKLNQFTIKEEMGFSDDEIKWLLIKEPKLWMIDQNSLRERFDYVHLTMKCSHDMILQSPAILNCRLFRIRQRHEYLMSLKRAQYDPKQELYVSLLQLIKGSDQEFAENVAKTTAEDFDKYLRIL